MAEPAAKQPHTAFVLHRRPWRETSLLVELFTADAGRIGAVARGARRGSRRQAMLCEPFVELQVAWRGRGDLAQLVSAETLAVAAQRVTGPALFSGFYLNELLVRMLRRHDPYPELYQAYRGALSALAAGLQVEPTLRLFERQLLGETGYGLQLACDSGSGAPLEAEAWYRYEAERGPFRVAGPQASGLVVSGRTLLALAQGAFDNDAQLRECKRLLRTILATHLGGKPLRSRELFPRQPEHRPRRADTGGGRV
jgi:DNA repair protein RecO (recombination protein O)